jgi:hypothetical protein
VVVIVIVMVAIVHVAVRRRLGPRSISDLHPWVDDGPLSGPWGR